MISSEMTLAREENLIIVRSRNLEGDPKSRILLLPDRATLGDSWGKEVRRMLADELFSQCELTVCAAGSQLPEQTYDRIVVCCSQQEEGFDMAARKPASQLFIVHPIGRPNLVKPIENEVFVFLPFLDTKGSGRLWRKEAARQK